MTPAKKGPAAGGASGAAPPKGGRGRHHVRFGWWALLTFLTLGIALELMHAFKWPGLLAPEQETRRFLWTLAHAHGTLLSLVNIAFGLSAAHAGDWKAPAAGTASICLRTAVVLMPLGFFAGGFFVYGGDPGLGILLVPVGALALFVGVFLAAREVHRATAE